MQHCAATPSDGEDLLDWTVFDSSIDSDDLGLPGFAVPSKSKKQAEELGKCYGCGVELQKESSRTPGFITESTFDVKTRHKQRNSILCSRCGTFQAPSCQPQPVLPRCSKTSCDAREHTALYYLVVIVFKLLRGADAKPSRMGRWCRL